MTATPKVVLDDIEDQVPLSPLDSSSLGARFVVALLLVVMKKCSHGNVPVVSSSDFVGCGTFFAAWPVLACLFLFTNEK